MRAIGNTAEKGLGRVATAGASLRRLLDKLRGDASGNILVIAGAASFGLAGGAGLAVDTAQWYLWKRQLQQAVDSGALAAANTMSQGGSWSAAATSEINRNANTSLTVERIGAPPLTGAYSGDTRAVEVIATTQTNLPFSSLFLDSPPTIRARAVATAIKVGENCVIALAPDGIGVDVSGTADVKLGCGVIANSSGVKAVDLTGSSLLDADPISAFGNINASPTNYAAGTSILPFGPKSDDPLAARGLSVPSSPSSCTQNNYSVSPSDTVTLSPGRYCNGLSLKGDVTLSPGVYIIDRGEFYISSQANVVGEGVTFVLTGSSTGNMATLNFVGGAEIDLRAPTAAEDPFWKNILIYQDPLGSTKESTLAGDSNLDFEGVVYMPNGDLKFTGSSGQHSECLLMVAKRIAFSGDASLDNDCSSEYDDLDFTARRIVLVE